MFPHIQGPIPWLAVVAELTVTLRDGRLEVPDLTPYDVVVRPPRDPQA